MATSQDPETVQVDERTQLILRRLSGSETDDDTINSTDRCQLLSELEETFGHNQVELTKQILRFAGDSSHEGSAGMQARMLPRVLTQQLGISRNAIVGACIPHLKSPDDPLRASAISLLKTIENASVHRRPDFSYYAGYLYEDSNGAGQPSRWLVEYMFSIHLHEGLLALARTDTANRERYRSILLAEHEVTDVLWRWQFAFLPQDNIGNDVVKALIPLAQSDAWWVRLYVAQVMADYPIFRRPDLLKPLADEQDITVLEVLATFLPEAKARLEGLKAQEAVDGDD